MPYELLNTYEKRSLHQRAMLYSEQKKAERKFKCPKCGTDKSINLIMLRRGYGECRLCDAKILVKDNVKEQFILVETEEETQNEKRT